MSLSCLTPAAFAKLPHNVRHNRPAQHKIELQDKRYTILFT